jgi:hypothetical protein
MQISEVLSTLKKRGHQVGQSAVSPDGYMLVNIDGTLMKYVEARELLLKESEGRKRLDSRFDGEVEAWSR